MSFPIKVHTPFKFCGMCSAFKLISEEVYEAPCVTTKFYCTHESICKAMYRAQCDYEGSLHHSLGTELEDKDYDKR